MSTEISMPGEHGDPGGGLLMACLAFLIAVLGAMGAFRPAVRRVTQRPHHVSTLQRAAPRAPRLAQLCVLRM